MNVVSLLKVLFVRKVSSDLAWIVNLLKSYRTKPCYLLFFLESDVFSADKIAQNNSYQIYYTDPGTPLFLTTTT